MFDTLKTKDTNLLIRDLQVIEKEIESMTKVQIQHLLNCFK